MSLTSVLRVAIVIAAGLALVGCGDVSGTDDDGGIEFHPFERDAEVERDVDLPEPKISLEEQSKYKEILSGFRNNAVTLFGREGFAQRRIAQIQKIYLGSGKYLEFVAILQRVVDELGLDSPAATRLAWAYIRLGQDRQAQQFLERLVAARPKDPDVAVIEGSFWFQRARRSRVAMARATVAWRRALELTEESDAEPRRKSVKALRRRVELMERRLPRRAEEILARAEQRRGGATDGSEESGEATEGAAPPMALEESPSADGSESGRPSGEERAGEDRPGSASDGGEAPGERAASSEEESTPVPVLVSKGDLALGEGNAREAATFYRRALKRESGHIDARFGLVRARWSADSSRKKQFRRALEKILQQSELTARQAYEVGLFAGNQLDASELKRRFWKRARELDADYADRVGIP